jgi:Protein of unknown function (DUF3153)
MGRIAHVHRSAGKRSAAGKSAVGKPALLRLVLHWIVKLRLFWLILVAFLFLSGCVQYDVGITFRDANHGSLTQQVRLSDQLTGVSRATANLWLDKLTEQTQQLGGKTKHPTDQEWVMTIPFYNAKDLSTKFDRFFAAITSIHSPDPSAHASTPISRLQIKTNNLILWQRNRLTYELDLRSLSVIPDAAHITTLLVNPKDLLALELTLNTPWGAQSLDAAPRSSAQHQGNSLIWTLTPGEINHLEAIFWLPSSIGMGLAVIVVFVIVGMVLKAWQDASARIDFPTES